MAERLVLGIDLGTYQSTIMGSNDTNTMVETVVGRPKDPVARNFLGKDVLFGAEAMVNKLACTLYRPLQSGVPQDDETNRAAARSFVQHLIEKSDSDEFDEVYGVICSPSTISFTDKSNLMSFLKGSVNAIMVVSEPFAVAFSLDEVGGSIIVDIGSGSTDIARIYGTFPNENDQISIEGAGDSIDEVLAELIRGKYTGAQVTLDMVRAWKEENSYVQGEDRKVMDDLPVEGKTQNVDIGDLIKEACETIMTPIVNGLKEIVAGADPEYQPLLRNNIILAGGGSLIDNIEVRIADELSEIGDITINKVDDPFQRVADGALKLGMIMPDEQFVEVPDK